MENCDCISIVNLTESEDFIKKNCNIDSVDDILNELLYKWPKIWNEFDDVADDIRQKVMEAHGELSQICDRENLNLDTLYIALECILLNKLHDHIMPLIYYDRSEEDQLFYDKCKRLCDLNVTAEQLGAPEDYAIPMAAAVVEFASLDNRKSPIEKVHCLCTTYDLVFAELKAAIIEIISKTSDENEIPIIENQDVLPILMIVIIKSKLIHLHTNIFYVEKFLWKLQESEHVQSTISIFKNAAAQISALNEKNLRPSSGKIRKDLDLIEVTDIMANVEVTPKESKSLLNNHIQRVSDLILTSTKSIYSN